MEVSLVIGGDFNSVCDQLLARSKAPLPSDTQASAAMNEQQVQHAVSNFWCLIHLNNTHFIPVCIIQIYSVVNEHFTVHCILYKWENPEKFGSLFNGVASINSLFQNTLFKTVD